MTRWTAIVLALPAVPGEELASRLVNYLHPVAGRPLVWHAAASLAALDPPPDEVVLVSGVELQAEHFHDLAAPVRVLRVPEVDLANMGEPLGLDPDVVAIVMDAAALASPDALQTLLDAPAGSWLHVDEWSAAAASVAASRLPQLFRLPEPLATPNGVLAAHDRLADPRLPSLLVRDRADLARVTQRIRDRLVRALMRGGATFLLPESVLVDVDVRVGRDSVVYPGVVLEGQTTIGDETVVGPGCRIIDSWVGSGVELKGWNYLAHTSIRNRAILEPYVRRGFD